MRGALAAVIAMGCAGCADPGDFYQQRINIANPRTNQYRIEGPGYAMTFAQDGTKLPESLQIASEVEALQDGTCPTESLAGIAVYPAVLAAGDNLDASATLEIVEQGPGVISVAVDFEVPFSCGGGTPAMSGRTTYTFYPSSRIVRHDRVSPTNTPLTSNAGCGCNSTGSSGWIFTSYWAFATTRLVDRTGTPLSGSGAVETCARIGDHLIAHAWQPGGSTRTALADNTATVYDFPGGSTLPTDYREVTSAIQIGYAENNVAYAESRCDELQRGLVGRPLTVDGQLVQTNEHGLYVDSNVHTGGTFEILADDGDVPPFGIILDIGGAGHVRVGRSPGAYAVQPASNGAVLFWFDDGLADNNSIQITPY